MTVAVAIVTVLTAALFLGAARVKFTGGARDANPRPRRDRPAPIDGSKSPRSPGRSAPSSAGRCRRSASPPSPASSAFPWGLAAQVKLRNPSSAARIAALPEAPSAATPRSPDRPRSLRSPRMDDARSPGHHRSSEHTQPQEVENGSIKDLAGSRTTCASSRSAPRKPRIVQRLPARRPRQTSRQTATTLAPSASSRPRQLRENRRRGTRADLGLLGRCAAQLGRAHHRRCRHDIESRKAEHDKHKVERRAGRRAEEDAGFAIDIAYSAVVEAEYSVLDAALARMEADELSQDAAPTD